MDEELAEATRFGRMSVPRFRRIAVGRISRTSFANAASLVEGERDVVTSGLGSMIPDKCAYSSSMSAWASAVSSNL